MTKAISAEERAENLSTLEEESGELFDLYTALELEICEELRLSGFGNVESDYCEFDIWDIWDDERDDAVLEKWSRWFSFDTKDDATRFESFVNSVSESWQKADSPYTVGVERRDLFRVYQLVRTEREAAR